MPDVCPNRVKNVGGPSEIFSCSTNHDGERSGLGTPNTATDWSIEIAATRTECGTADALGGVRTVRAEIDP